MESFGSFNTKRNRSFIYKNLKLSILDFKNKDEENVSLNYKKTESNSTAAEEKNENNDIKRDNSQKNKASKKINIDNISNFNNEKNIEYIFKKCNKGIKEENDGSKMQTFSGKNEVPLQVNNHKIRKGKCIKHVKKNKNVILKPSPPAINYLHDYKYNLSNNNIIINRKLSNPKLPHVFINHLLTKDNPNVNIFNNFNFIQLAVTTRIKAKNLTILYYRPLKK